MNSRCRNNIKSLREEGFTLLEMMIAMAVMVFMSFAIYQATTETFHLRDVLSNEGDFNNGIRLAMNILQRDVALLYNPILVMPPKKESAAPPDPRELEALMAGDLGRSTQYWGPAADMTGIRPSHFIGSETKMSFVSVSHIRIYRDSPESELVKISYELRPDEGNSTVQDAQVLVKIESPNAYEDEESRDKLSTSFPLLHGIKQFKYRYYRKDKDQWSTSWDTDKEEYKDIYPDIIELTLQVKGPFQLSFDGVFKFRPEVPLRGLDPST